MVIEAIIIAAGIVFAAIVVATGRDEGRTRANVSWAEAGKFNRTFERIADAIAGKARDSRWRERLSGLPPGPWSVDTDLEADDSRVYVRVVDAIGGEVVEVTYTPRWPGQPSPEQMAEALVAVVNEIRV